MDTFSDDTNGSIPDLTSRNYFTESNEEAIRSDERGRERIRIEQRFMDMNRQIGELTIMVEALTEKISNGREENGQNVRNVETSLRSDSMKMITFFVHLNCEIIVSQNAWKSSSTNFQKVLSTD